VKGRDGEDNLLEWSSVEGMELGMVSDDFRKKVLGYGLTTAQILYRMPDHPSLLQTYVWQNYDLFPKFPALKDFLAFWQEKLDGPLFSVTPNLRPVGGCVTSGNYGIGNSGLRDVARARSCRARAS
jgi:uncharacterized protein Usg